MELGASFTRIIIIPLFALPLLMVCHPSEGSCRNLEIRTVIKDKVLTNHTIRTIQPIIDARTCRAQCFLEMLCFGVNVCVDLNSTATCELTNSDHIRSETDLVDKPGCTFYGSETACSSSPCVGNATCQGDFVEDAKPYRCICPMGYTGQKCEIDLDECSLSTHDCHVNATCKNIIGGHNCSCKNGFYGNGRTCHDIDECSSDAHDCHVNATCSNTIGGYNCKCKAPSYGNGTVCSILPPENCTELRSLLIRYGQDVLEGGIIGQGTNRRYCVFSEIPGCDAGPWTLVMKINGSLSTFDYNSSLWTNALTFQPEANNHGLDNTETKSSAFWNTPLNKLCFGMEYGGIKRWISFDIQAKSLYDVMNNANETLIHVGEEKWRTLLPPEETSMTENCPKEGFNLDGAEDNPSQKRLLRFGFFKDDNLDCLSYSSFIGLAGYLENMKGYRTINCGNFAGIWKSDNGEMSTEAFCYVLVQ